ncbi:hypothetical protein E2C01_085852 [Portunus trituberculatus]|uniref:Uncharacterized protein n=1 Tax=Portunus trituberculatus TaxID=210409 RepID=A0A5B7J7T2_PORTR|nr:hypothetical protein [Portunus trituberculatus]
MSQGRSLLQHELYGRWSPLREVVALALVPRPSTSHTAVPGSTQVQDPKKRTRYGAGCRSGEEAERYPAVTKIETGGGCFTTSKPEWYSGSPKGWSGLRLARHGCQETGSGPPKRAANRASRKDTSGGRGESR